LLALPQHGWSPPCTDEDEHFTSKIGAHHSPSCPTQLRHPSAGPCDDPTTHIPTVVPARPDVPSLLDTIDNIVCETAAGAGAEIGVGAIHP